MAIYTVMMSDICNYRGRVEVEEQVERVPWSVLESREKVATWWWYLGGTVLLVAALSAGLVYAMASDDPVTMFDDVSTVTMLSAADGSETAIAVTTTALAESAAVAPPPTASIYSEADLLALVDDGSEQLVAAAAEVFVQRYFARSDAAHVSHVEWARVIRIDQRDAGGYSAEVAFSTVAGPTDGPFTRIPLRAVSVDVAVVAGSAQVIGLPKTLDRMPIDSPRPVEEVVGVEALPSAAILAAQTAAAPWGIVEIVGGWQADTWTVMVAVTDETGVRWELAVDTAVS